MMLCRTKVCHRQDLVDKVTELVDSLQMLVNRLQVSISVSACRGTYLYNKYSKISLNRTSYGTNFPNCLSNQERIDEPQY